MSCSACSKPLRGLAYSPVASPGGPETGDGSQLALPMADGAAPPPALPPPPPPPGSPLPALTCEECVARLGLDAEKMNAIPGVSLLPPRPRAPDTGAEARLRAAMRNLAELVEEMRRAERLADGCCPPPPGDAPAPPPTPPPSSVVVIGDAAAPVTYPTGQAISASTRCFHPLFRLLSAV